MEVPIMARIHMPRPPKVASVLATLGLLVLAACAGGGETRMDPVTGLYVRSSSMCSASHLPGTIRRVQAKAAAGELPLSQVEMLVLQRAAAGNCVPYDPDYYPDYESADLVCTAPCERYESARSEQEDARR
ncbi:MAG: hypothetical protein ACRDI2_24210 [Chloroflexota bacterium]